MLDPIIWADINGVAAAAEGLRAKVLEIISRREFPPELRPNAELLTYNLRKAYLLANLLAGERPPEMSPR